VAVSAIASAKAAEAPTVADLAAADFTAVVAASGRREWKRAARLVYAVSEGDATSCRMP